MDLSKEIKTALNSIYGRKSITDMNVQCAISILEVKNDQS